MSDTYTRPELSTERGIAKRELAKILREGRVCEFCTHRDPQTVFGRTVCQKFGRSFPLCSSTPGLQFDPDHDRLKGAP